MAQQSDRKRVNAQTRNRTATTNKSARGLKFTDAPDTWLVTQSRPGDVRWRRREKAELTNHLSSLVTSAGSLWKEEKKKDLNHLNDLKAKPGTALKAR